MKYSIVFSRGFAYSYKRHFLRKHFVKPIAEMKLIVLLSCAFAFQASATLKAQKVNLNLKNATIAQALDEIHKQTKYDISYNDLVVKDHKKITINLENATFETAMNLILDGKPFRYELNDKIIIIKSKSKENINSLSNQLNTSIQNLQQQIIQGVVTNSKGEPLEGATVQLLDAQGKTTPIQTKTNQKGEFILRGIEENSPLEIRYIGHHSVRIFAKSNIGNIKLSPIISELSEVEIVSTGIFSRRKDSFTGSSATYTGKELKEVGVQNVIQSLRTLDPTFNLIENTQFGSDPNRLPDLEIRGKTSFVGLKEQYGEDPNQPLFILDGFETTLQVIMDISMDRIASATILKDASSTAIYGAKAANGVVVIETKAPVRGKLRVTYNGSLDLTFADLSDYNLMNASEKLDFELLSGNFKSNNSIAEEEKMIRYNNLLHDVKRGVDTYWLAEPLRTGVNQRNNFYLEGGDQEMRYGIGVNNRTIQGVMSKSKRNNLSGNIDLIYRKDKISFMNKLTIDDMNSANPIVAFSEYARANPYYRKVNEFGGVDKWLEPAGQFLQLPVSNPLWDDALNSYDRSNSFGIRNNFNAEYRPLNYLTLRARLGVTKNNQKTESFFSPDATRFDGVEDLRKGQYKTLDTKVLGYEGDLTATFGKLFNNIHLVNIVAGTSLNQSSSLSQGFGAEGFPEGNFTTPAFSNSYPNTGRPDHTDSKRRNAGFFMNSGYSINNKYLFDFNLRSDGTSVFGSNRKFSTTWSTGIAWNIHNESFIKNNFNDVTMLKIRASVGNPGNQSFGAYNALSTYKFNNWLQNYFGTGLLLDKFGDPNLEWQKTLDKNIGFDLSVLSNRLHVNFDYYDKETDPLLATVGIPLSVGISNRMMNVGMQVDRGFNGSIRYAVLYRPSERINWTTSLSFRKGTAYYDKIGNRLDSYNRENLSKNLSRYYNGASPTALWSVRSNGIDPASGREIFISQSGEKVFGYSFFDEVVVGDTRPVLEGVFGNTFMYKGFSANIHLRYSYGGDIFNSTLYSKVENISSSELIKNQDRRALYDRWRNVGDIAQFKGISLSEYTPISSRFVQQNNYLSIESVRVGYDFRSPWMTRMKVSSIQVNAYMNDIARLSSIKVERGIDFPFARTVSFGLNVNF